MSERETVSFKTSGGHEIVMNSYITGHESRSIKNIYLSKLEFQQSNHGQSFGGVTGSATIEAENKALEVVVVSVNGQSDKIVDRIMDLPSVDADEIVEKVNEITGGKKKSEQGD